MNLTDNQRQVLEAYTRGLQQGKFWGRNNLARETGLSLDQVRHALARLRHGNLLPIKPNAPVKVPPPVQITDDELYLSLRADISKKSNRDRLHTLEVLATRYAVPPKRIQRALLRLADEGYNVHQDQGNVALTSQEATSAPVVIDTDAEPERLHFGFVSDSHLGSRRERLDCLNDLYDLYAQHGIQDVYHAGNMLEGVKPKINLREIHKYSLDQQVDYMTEVYPQRPGITTWYVTGDDHEGWFQQDVGMSIGRYMQTVAESHGRTDLRYLGFVEQDVFFKSQVGSFFMKIQHPGGGSAYALSYTPQKIVESFTGGEKPSVLLLGHYHKLEMMPNLRNVRVYQGGCTVDQSVWARKKRLQYHLGGWRIHLRQCATTGACIGAISEDRTYYNQEFYDHKDWEQT